MKLVVAGFGQCGGRLADEFVRLAVKARQERHIGIVSDIIAINTDAADLSGLTNIKKDLDHRILIGVHRGQPHGAAKIAEGRR